MNAPSIAPLKERLILLAGAVILFLTLAAPIPVGWVDDAIRAVAQGGRAARLARLATVLERTAARLPQMKNAACIIRLEDDIVHMVSATQYSSIPDLATFIRNSPTDEVLIDAALYEDNILSLGKEIYVLNEFDDPYRIIKTESGSSYLVDDEIRVRLTTESSPQSYVARQTWDYHLDEESVMDILDIVDYIDTYNDVSSQETNDGKYPVMAHAAFANTSIDFEDLFEEASNKLLILPGYYDDSGFSIETDGGGAITYDRLEQLAADNEVYCMYVGFEPEASIDYDLIQQTIENQMASDQDHRVMGLFRSLAGLSATNPELERFYFEREWSHIDVRNPEKNNIRFVEFSSPPKPLTGVEKGLQPWWEDHFWLLCSLMTAFVFGWMYFEESKKGEDMGIASWIGLLLAAAIVAVVLYFALWVVVWIVAGIFGV